MKRRQGATLIEVLVAIFIMGIGLLCLLTLFPLGVLRMAKAIQDDRAGQAARAAAAIAELRLPPTLQPLRNDPDVIAALLTSNGQGLPPNPEGRSYPVLVDPIGFLSAFGTPTFNQVAGAVDEQLAAGAPPKIVPLLPRLAPRFVSAPPPAAGTTSVREAYKWFTLLDDVVLDAGADSSPAVLGTPKQLIPGVIERDTRFSWAFLLQRPRSADPSVVEVSVIVYNSRPLNLNVGNLSLPESKYHQYDNPNKLSEVVYDASRNVVRVRWEYFGSLQPQVRAGDWILDVSYVRGEKHAFFYRVAGVREDVEELPAAGSGQFYAFVEFELQQPLRGFLPNEPAFGWSPDPRNRPRLVVLEGVAEVFERGLGRTP
jgi:prepilin-type N-terminal cleavage/methylation domain-containing protein